jgi:hypothetical protein
MLASKMAGLITLTRVIVRAKITRVMIAVRRRKGVRLRMFMRNMLSKFRIKMLKQVIEGRKRLGRKERKMIKRMTMP